MAQGGLAGSGAGDGGDAAPLAMSLSELTERLRAPAGEEALSPLAGVSCVVAEVDTRDAGADLPPCPCPVIAVAGREAPAIVDVAVPTAADADVVVDAVAANPVAAMVLVRLLRHNERASVPDGLFAESLAYSSLQHGAEFLAWLADRSRRQRTAAAAEPEPPVLLQRTGERLRITLNRPQKRNAYSTALRDALCEALTLPLADASIAEVLLEGAGACFSAGGDLTEFGEARDAALAHASRMTRSAGALLHRLRDRTTARLHGACIGAGIELPAFAGRVIAREDAFFQLPEVGMGLIPGAGGTASILPRIGRQRLAYMALSGTRIDAATARSWGLVDAIEDWR